MREATGQINYFLARCPLLKRVKVRSALYGLWPVKIENATHGICPNCGNNFGNCGQALFCQVDLTNYAKDECDGNRKCSFTGDRTIAGDPCPGFQKFTFVSYDCIDANPSSSVFIPTPLVFIYSFALLFLI